MAAIRKITAAWCFRLSQTKPNSLNKEEMTLNPVNVQKGKAFRDKT